MQKFMCYCIVFALFYFEFEGNFEYMPSGACIWRGELSEGFLRYEFRGAYVWRGLFSEFYARAKQSPIRR